MNSGMIFRFWEFYFATAILWAVVNLWVYREYTQPGRELGLSGSLSVWTWDFYLALGIVAGAICQPFGIKLATGWQMLGLVAALAGVILALWGMFEFRSPRPDFGFG